MGSSLLLVGLVFSACDQGRTDDRSPRDPVVRDSAGIEIVDLGRIRYADLPQWRIADSPTLDIGRIQGAEPYLLYRVPDALVMPDGRVAVSSNRQIRMFDRDGVHLWSQGREGEGPGEYGSAWKLTRTVGDTLVVSDGRSFTVVGPDGDFVREVTPGVLPTGLTTYGATLEGEVVGWNCEREWFEGDRFRENRVMCDMFITDLEGRVLGDLGEIVTDRTVVHPTRILGMAPPWQGRPVLGAGPVGAWYGPGDRYELRLYRGSGTPARIVRWQGPDLRVTEDDVRSYDRKIESQDLPAASIAFEKSIPKPERFPTFNYLLVDGSGRLWLRDFERWDLERPPVFRWTVLAADGSEILARFENDRETWLLDAGDGWVLLRELDELEVEHVRMYPLVEVGGG